MSDLKVEGKVADFCPKCKNCKSTTRECDGKKDWLTEIECEDPYDGMIRTLAADSDICCSMFTPKPDRACAKCERFDGTYCHGRNGTITIFGEPVDCPSFEEKKDKEFNTLVSDLHKEIQELKKENTKLTERNVDLVAQCDETYHGYRDCKKLLNDILDTVYEHPEMFERNMTAYELLPGRVKTLKDSWDMMCDKYDPLNIENEQRKKAMDNQAKMIQDLKKERDELAEKLKRVKSHDEALTKHFQNDEKLIDNIQKVIFPQGEGSDYTYSYDEILNKVKDLKVQSDENGTMYEDLKYWKERCHNAESDVTTLTSEVGALNNMYNRLKDKNDKDVMHSLHLSYELNKMKSEYETECKSGSNIAEENVKLEAEINDLKEKNENLTKMVERRDRWVNDLQSDVYTLQNELLTIRNIAQKAYDDTNRD